jgi:hypothetical protein
VFVYLQRGTRYVLEAEISWARRIVCEQQHAAISRGNEVVFLMPILREPGHRGGSVLVAEADMDAQLGQWGASMAKREGLGWIGHGSTASGAVAVPAPVLGDSKMRVP